MGSSHSSEPSRPLEAETEVEEVVVEEEVEEEDPVDEFLEHSIRWLFGIS